MLKITFFVDDEKTATNDVCGKSPSELLEDGDSDNPAVLFFHAFGQLDYIVDHDSYPMSVEIIKSEPDKVV